MQIDAKNIKAFLKVDGDWQEIEPTFNFNFAAESQDIKENSDGLVGSISGWAEIEFKDKADIGADLRKNPKLEAWKANGKRKKPRCK